MSVAKKTFLAVGCYLLLSMSGCAFTSGEDDTVSHYNLSDPEKFLMPESLLEISGICFNKGKSDTIYAIQDEQGRLFRLKWGLKKQVNAKFGRQGDYEDVAVLNGQVFILKSNGTLFSFPLADAAYEDIDNAKEYKKLLPEGEYEGMCSDEATGSLYIICKNCKDDDSKSAVTGYIFKADESLSPAGTFQVNVNEIKSLSGKVKRGFRPSAISKNPVNGDWYIVSSVNKLLVVADKNWKIKESVVLNGNVFNQPEGLAFDEFGNLFISNEGDDFTQGNILKFARLP